MMDVEWTTSEHLVEMLAATDGKISPRKYRLWVCAFARTDRKGLMVAGGYLDYFDHIRHAVELGERYCEGDAFASDLAGAARQAAWAYQVELSESQSVETIARHEFLKWGSLAADADIRSSVVAAARELVAVMEREREMRRPVPSARAQPADVEWEWFNKGHNESLITLFREVVGDPFRPVTFSPEWRSDIAVSLARGMYDSRDFSAMPILADALQDAGCDNADILDHCRDEKQVHVRGCWVVDLVLGKE